jgi:hypothetical protein
MKEVDMLSDTDDSIECGIPLIKEKQDTAWMVHAERVKSLTEWSRGVGIMLLTSGSVMLCLLFYFICPRCLFGMLLFSACLCPWCNTMNAPLWLAIVLLVVSGWTFTAGYLSVTWNSGSH